ncbi:MAG: RloB family protein [Candidatus Muirbacterium halophilum]|nr:RloB family protein [Candidatus Muirbacterium halophilum]
MSKKPWNQTGKGKRRIQNIQIKDKILIVCGGEETEPNYFKSFPVKTEVVEVDIIPTNRDPLKVVEKAINLSDKSRKSSPYNQCWCVFDKDDFDKGDSFKKAIIKACQYNINIAYSIECFELWYLLHYDFLNTTIKREDYILKLNKNLIDLMKKTVLKCTIY